MFGQSYIFQHIVSSIHCPSQKCIIPGNVYSDEDFSIYYILQLYNFHVQIIRINNFLTFIFRKMSVPHEIVPIQYRRPYN